MSSDQNISRSRNIVGRRLFDGADIHPQNPDDVSIQDQNEINDNLDVIAQHLSISPIKSTDQINSNSNGSCHPAVQDQLVGVCSNHNTLTEDQMFVNQPNVENEFDNHQQIPQ